MNKTQEQLIKIINSTIHSKRVKFDKDEVINWDELLEEAREHSVTSLIYSSINKSNIINSLEKDRLNLLK